MRSMPDAELSLEGVWRSPPRRWATMRWSSSVISSSSGVSGVGQTMFAESHRAHGSLRSAGSATRCRVSSKPSPRRPLVPDRLCLARYAGNTGLPRASARRERTVAYIRSAFETQPFEYVAFRAPTFTLDGAWVRRPCEALPSEPRSYLWKCVTPSHHLDEELIAARGGPNAGASASASTPSKTWTRRSCPLSSVGREIALTTWRGGAAMPEPS